MDDSLLEVAIPTFVNPHLFWIVEFKSQERVKTLKILNKLMQDRYKVYDSDYNESFEVGEIVAVKKDNKYFRAIIEEIHNMETEDESVLSFMCWLIDYGTMYETNIVYKLPSTIRKWKPLAMQSSLNNVTYVQQHLTYDDLSGQAVKSNEPVLTPTSIAHQKSLELMADINGLQFKIEDKVDGILCGDILYKENGQIRSLRQSLVDRGILMVHEKLFQEIQENIYSYKESNLSLIAQVCKKLNSINIVQDSYNGNQDCRRIISKYLEEFGDQDLYNVEHLEPLSNRRSRSRNPIDSDNISCSENDSRSDNDMSKKLDNSITESDKFTSPTVCRIKLLLEKFKRKQHANEAKVHNSLDGNVDSSHFNESPTNIRQKFSEHVSKNMELSINDGKENHGICDGQEDLSSTNIQLSSTHSGEANMPGNTKFKNRNNPNLIFQPGGASFTLKHIKKNTIKRSESTVKLPSQSIFPMEDSSSDCKSKNASVKSYDIHHTNDESSSPEENHVELHQTFSDTEKSGQLQVKPHCHCKQCDHWTNDNEWKIEADYHIKSKQIKRLIVQKPQPLFKVDDHDIDNDVSILSLNYASLTKIKKQAIPKLLVHGECLPGPVRIVSEANFHKTIHETLHQLEYRQAKRIQSYAWPGLLGQQNVCMINGPQTGKTMGYLPIILSFLLERHERYKTLISKAGGPIFIILCTNSKKCEEIYDLSKILLGNNQTKISLITYPLTYINASHVDLLVTTPRILIDLLKMKAINFKRLCHLVLEDGDKILRHYSEDMNMVFDLIKDMLNHRVCSKQIQLIICAEHWTYHIEKLLKSLSKTPLVCIANFLEAALYGKMQFSMKFLNSACKEQELKSILKDTYRIYKSIILCKNSEIEEVETILRLKGIDATVISENLSKEDIIYLEEVWTESESGQYTVLVCTDFLLNSVLTVTSAALLIHYSLPHSWTKFIKRFCCLLETCNSPLINKQYKIKCKSVVLCDEECEDHMLKFFNFINMTGLKNQLTDRFKQFYKNLKESEEVKKINSEIGLCENLKLLGQCTNNQCPRRHIFDKNLDISNRLPDSGKIKFKIVDIQDVTVYSVRLIQHIDLENKIYEFDDILDVTEDLTNTLRISKRRVTHPIIGHLYAYYDIDELDGVYYRCDLLEFDVDSIKVKLIDKGTIISTMKTRLYRLPKEFSEVKFPRKVIDVYLANYIPPYQDENFSAKAFYNLKNLLEKNEYKNMIIVADIYLQLGNALWLKNVFQEVVLSDKTVYGFSLTREIMQLKLVVYNNNQLNNLYKLCNEASITLPTYEKQRTQLKKEEKKIQVCWAHLNANETNKVIFSSVISPDEIYIRLNKFHHLLYTLHKEIQDSLRKPNYPKLVSVEVGTICLAKDPQGTEYLRVIVLSLEDNDALCFFVDFGDEAVINISDLKYIHEKFITKLPFQSIQCRLHGIKPILGDWQSDLTDTLEEYAMEPNTDIFRSLFVKSCGKEKNEVIPEQNRYSILLKDGFGEKNVLINELLINCGLVLPNSEEISDFDIPECTFDRNEIDKEQESIMDILMKTEEIEENCDYATKSGFINDDMELVLINPKEFFEKILTNNGNAKSQTNNSLPAIQAAPPVDYYTPEVLWSQTEEIIKIDIKLHDVKDYVLNLTKSRILNFKTTKNEKTYIFKHMLYEKVNSIQHTSMGSQVRATLIKIKGIEWPRLILSKQRTRNIHYDLSAINVKEDTRRALELPKFSDDDDEESDDNIDVMYHVVSDLDSDMDADMPLDSD